MVNPDSVMLGFIVGFILGFVIGAAVSAIGERMSKHG